VVRPRTAAGRRCGGRSRRASSSGHVRRARKVQRWRRPEWVAWPARQVSDFTTACTCRFSSASASLPLPEQPRSGPRVPDSPWAWRVRIERPTRDWVIIGTIVPVGQRSFVSPLFGVGRRWTCLEERAWRRGRWASVATSELRSVVATDVRRPNPAQGGSSDRDVRCVIQRHTHRHAKANGRGEHHHEVVQTLEFQDRCNRAGRPWPSDRPQ
jgi:hypothetical protein